jgi:uncharacterized protein YjiS (DUF1127 family)
MHELHADKACWPRLLQHLHIVAPAASRDLPAARKNKRHSHGGIMLPSIRIGLSRTFAWIDEWQQRRALRELRRLDDRLLANIGLSRAEIEQAIRNDRPGHQGGETRRELIARSSQGIMTANRAFSYRGS